MCTCYIFMLTLFCWLWSTFTRPSACNDQILKCWFCLGLILVSMILQIWKGEEVQTDDEVGVKCTLISPDGDEGFPGKLSRYWCLITWYIPILIHFLFAKFINTGKVTASITYTLNKKNELKLYYEATTDADTVHYTKKHFQYLYAVLQYRSCIPPISDTGVLTVEQVTLPCI